MAIEDGTRMRLADVYPSLRDAIMHGEIPPESRVNIDALARQMGVSATPIREALRQLEQDRLVRYLPRRGYVTTPTLDVRGLRELYDFRLLVEPWAARCASRAGIANPSLALLTEIRTVEQFAVRGLGLRPELVAHDEKFHSLIVAAVENSFARDAYQNMHVHVHTYRLHPESIQATDTLREHRAIAEAIAAEDELGAHDAMEAHVRASFERLAATINE